MRRLRCDDPSNSARAMPVRAAALAIGHRRAPVDQAPAAARPARVPWKNASSNTE